MTVLNNEMTGNVQLSVAVVVSLSGQPSAQSFEFVRAYKHPMAPGLITLSCE